MKKIENKINYEETEIEAQGCWNDCKVTYKTNTTPDPGSDLGRAVGGSAVTVIVCTTKKKTTYTPKTNPFL